MKLVISNKFYKKLDRQVKYIAKDKPETAIKFRKSILSEIRKIPGRMWSYRQSEFFEDEKIRELIFKGYRIVFEIGEENILVFGFHKWENTLNP
ncbi:type II toxin-antitoxin system RelE/ParE family toxin [Epilithonimonas xixisoli]|uniref:ParE-like toxin of type II ParDE toxin-antitoxin system n=1 Tax=Epilithonimonas xixisoli TaxID=1476462 RepID=A0A4R8IAS8_9FLAO|nr:type II toxin-antitoxin system RelE/ParE family toxin [Epilithonimonas xixisoli]TDX84421.1 ParE-like toxin of type II ParDE toxin-antitoxin system [Epilithonimonas xixisoli]